MADNTVEVRLVATDELSTTFAEAAQNVGDSIHVIEKDMSESARNGTQAWTGMLREIDSAETAFVRDVFSGRQSLSQSLLDLGARLVEGEIANDLKYFTNYAILSALGVNTDRLASQQGLLAHLLMETEKTAATTQGVAARSAAETTGASTGLIAQAAGAIKSIAIDAGQTFAGIFAFLSPLMGPAAAGPAAAGEAAVYAAAGSIAAFDVGAWSIPQDMMGVLHAGETVVPESFASGLRAAASGGAGDGTGATNVTFAPQISALDGKSVVALFNNPSIMRQFARNLQSYLAANPSARGSY
ncbi:MAG TPA: hypothetical protein VH020_03265 [Stellaceae bacterium]|jgi:hypothetical protein|nr:hypothetical protein [Stellaceae bacterium]